MTNNKINNEKGVTLHVVMETSLRLNHKRKILECAFFDARIDIIPHERMEDVVLRAANAYGLDIDLTEEEIVKVLREAVKEPKDRVMVKALRPTIGARQAATILAGLSQID
ncbi:hypothetical protein WA026_020804 [Henosepilachna vigintioctopunctata]|uniref:Uncharacterized protein n=1 Tax=Henosepilachna vigintioctopunctata TaxID=420089 RepID=A0AAW1TWI2_9CUCU